MKLMLHICCAPCAVGVLKGIHESEGDACSVTGLYYNPNIHPEQEFAARRKSVERLSADYALPVLYDDDILQDYWKKNLAGDKENRCRVCYALRLDHTAKAAREEGMDAFTTTLLVSPWQDQVKIKELGDKAGQKYGIDFLFKDFRPFYRQGKNEAFQRQYYFQKYCGCLYSYQESDHKKKPEYTF